MEYKGAPSLAVTVAIEAFTNAPLEDGGWDRALKALARATRSSRAQLIGIGGPQATAFNWITDMPKGVAEGLAEIGGDSPAVNWRLAATRSPLQVVGEDDYARVRQRMKSPNLYDDYVAHYDAVHGCQTTLVQSEGSIIGLATLRTRSDGQTDEHDRAVFGTIAPHVLTAIRLQCAIDQQGARLVTGSLETMNVAAIVCDGTGRVAALTAMADRWLGQGSALKLSGGRIYAARPHDDRRFQRALGIILKSKELASPQRFWLGNDHGNASLTLCEIFALPRREWNFGFAPHALITIRTPQDIEPDQSQLLADALGLTAAEADVALRVGFGHSREQIAHQRGSAPQTVNAQLKAIFRKAEITREAELVALVNKLLR